MQLPGKGRCPRWCQRATDNCRIPRTAEAAYPSSADSSRGTLLRLARSRPCVSITSSASICQGDPDADKQLIWSRHITQTTRCSTEHRQNENSKEYLARTGSIWHSRFQEYIWSQHAPIRQAGCEKHNPSTRQGRSPRKERCELISRSRYCFFWPICQERIYTPRCCLWQEGWHQPISWTQHNTIWQGLQHRRNRPRSRSTQFHATKCPDSCANWHIELALARYYVLVGWRCFFAKTQHHTDVDEYTNDCCVLHSRIGCSPTKDYSLFRHGLRHLRTRNCYCKPWNSPSGSPSVRCVRFWNPDFGTRSKQSFTGTREDSSLGCAIGTEGSSGLALWAWFTRYLWKRSCSIACQWCQWCAFTYCCGGFLCLAVFIFHSG